VKIIVLLGTLFFSALSSELHAQIIARPPDAPAPKESRDSGWLAHNWVRGFLDFGVAPPHNEPDLGRCAFPSQPGPGGTQSLCTAYARYLFSGYVEIQPLNRTIARHLFIFLEPKFSFGNNIPQLNYTSSMQPIAFDRSVGAGFQLPKHFEIRATQHQVDFLGAYTKNLGPGDLRTTGPYGLYATFSVRWYFGGYDHRPSGAY
jgi:hypothetical protein